MAKRIFKDMTPAERREARKEARLNKKKPEPVPQRFTSADTNRGKKAAVIERESMFESAPRGYQQTPEEKARVAAEAGENSNFEDIFLSVIQFLPPEQQSRAFSLFSVFRKQSPEDQKAVIDSLMTVAREQTGPLFDLYKKRITEDTEYNKAALNRQMNNAKALYDRLVQVTDTNALRDKAKTDRNMAKVIRNITNNAFVERVAGSGIQRRRTQEQLEEARLAKEDIEVAKGQKQVQAGQQLGQIEADIQARLAREDILKERDVFDTEQKEEESVRSLFLSLFENQMSGAGDDARENIETGAIDPTTGMPSTDISVTGGGSKAGNIRKGTDLRADVFSSGGTDDQRRTRSSEEGRVSRAKKEADRLAGVQQQFLDAQGRLFQLNQYRAALKLANRDTSEIDAEMARLKPIVEMQLRRDANAGNNNIRPGDLDFSLEQAADRFIFDNSGLIGRYGSKPLDREKLATILQDYATNAVPNFGKDFVGLDKEDFSYVYSTRDIVNPFGSLNFDESKRGPVPVPTSSLTNPRQDVLSPTTAPIRQPQPIGVQRVGNTVLPTAAAPAGSSLDLARQAASGAITQDQQRAARDAIMFPSNLVSVPGSKTQVDLSTRTYTGGKPLSRRR